MKVEVIFCSAVGDQFKNLTPGSIHEVVPKPKTWRTKGAPKGVAVIGADGAPVKLLNGEYKEVESNG